MLGREKPSVTAARTTLVSVVSGLPLMRSKGSSVGDGVLRWPRDRGTGREACEWEVGCRSEGEVGCGSDGLVLPDLAVRGDGSAPASLAVPFSCGRDVVLGPVDMAAFTCSSSCSVPINVGIK